MVLLLSCFLFYFLLVQCVRRGYYILAMVLILLFMYELVGPIAIYFSATELLPMAFISNEQLENIDSYVIAIAGLQSLTYLSFLLFHTENNFYQKSSQRQYSPFALILLFVFVCGIVSSATQAGSVRLLDYLGEDRAVTPLFSYGVVLLIPITWYAIHFWKRRDFYKIITISIAVLPLCIEIFSTSRRQYFAPCLAAIFLTILYEKNVRGKWASAVLLLGGAAVLLGSQYLVREQFSVSATGINSLYESTVLPQLSEFAAIGNTSQVAWRMFVIESQPTTLGLHYFYYILNSIPYIKLGDIWYSDYRTYIFAIYRDMAPWGGLSMVADSLFSFGISGIVFLGVLFGFSTARAHRMLVASIGSGFLLINLFIICPLYVLYC